MPISNTLKTPAHDWPAIIAAWQRSGLPQTTFCREHNISYSHFKYHRYGASRPPETTGASEKNSLNKTPAAFVPIRVTEAVLEACAEICFPSGVTLKVPMQSGLAPIMKALREFL